MSQNGHRRADLLPVEEEMHWYGCCRGKEAQTIVEVWRQEYNNHRPHSSLGYLTPAEFARRYYEKNQVTEVKQLVDKHKDGKSLIVGGTKNGGHPIYTSILLMAHFIGVI